MSIDIINQFQWDWNDLLKACLSLFAGFVLGFEREWKDKAAGFKTISIICLGSTLFSLLSYKIGMATGLDSTRIASYVVSGIGFLGAGVIFKDGINVNGLTTASIIWMSAAIGMAIGFGVFLTAAIFLFACFAIIISGKFINKRIIRTVGRMATLTLHRDDVDYREDIIESIRPLVHQLKIKKTTLTEDELTVVIEVLINKDNIRKFESKLLGNKKLLEVSL